MLYVGLCPCGAFVLSQTVELALGHCEIYCAIRPYKTFYDIEIWAMSCLLCDNVHRTTNLVKPSNAMAVGHRGTTI